MNPALILSEEDFDRLIERIAEAVIRRIRNITIQSASEAAVGRHEIAELLGVGIASIDRGVRDGSIPSMMLHSRRMFLPSQVYEALQERAA